MMKTLISAIAIICLAVSCKKDITDKQTTTVDNDAIQKAKLWFEKASGNAAVQINPDPFALHLKEIVPQWDNAVSFIEMNTMVVPVEIKNSNLIDSRKVTLLLVIKQNAEGDIESGHYSFFLTKDATITDAAILATGKIPADFNGANINYSIDGNFLSAKHYKDGQFTPGNDKIAFKANKNDQGGGTQNNMPINCDFPCIDWYWLTYIDGILVDEEYLFTTCPCGNGGGSGGGGTSYGETTIVNRTWVVKDQNAYPEIWQITATVQLTGIRFTGDPSSNYFTACDFIGSARTCDAGGAPVCGWTSHPLYNIFYEDSHSTSLPNIREAHANVSTHLDYPNVPITKSYGSQHIWYASDL